MPATEQREPGNGRGAARWLAAALPLALLAASVALAVLTYRAVDRELTQAATARNAALAQLAAATLAERLERVVDLAVSLASRVRFAELVAEQRWEEAVAIQRGVPAEFPFLERVFLADLQGTLRADAPPLPGVRGVNFAHRDWYRGVSREWRPYVSAVYRRQATPQREVIAVAAPVRARDGAPAGILVLQLSINAFFQWAAALDLGEGASLAVVDPEGKVAYASGAAPPGGPDGWLQAAHAAQHGWGVVVRQGRAQAFAARDAQLRLVQLAFGLFAALVAALAWGGQRLAARRREQLAQARAALAQNAERLRILGEIDRAMAAEQGADAIAAAVIQPLRKLLGVPRAIVNRVHLESDTAEWVAAAGRRREHVGPGVRFPLRLLGDAAALARGEPQLVDVRALPPSADSAALLASGVAYYQVVPMIAGGELFGAVSFGGPAPEFPAEQVGIAQEVATQLAIATMQTRLLARVRLHAGELEARVRERTAELEAANRELDAFSYSVSHDLRAPVRHIDGFVRLLAKELGASPPGRAAQHLATIDAAAKRMGRLVDDLLAFSRAGRQSMQASPIDMGALVREVAEELARDYPAAQLRIGALPPAAADRALLRQVWTNLLGNALKYSSKAAAPVVEVGGRETPAELEYWVQDNGAGFDPQYAQKLFNVFQRLHTAEEFPGTGVGLAIVQRVVARHGGRVRAEGAPGAGARFAFTLPREGAARAL